MSEIIVSGALQMWETNTPTRAGELVQNVAEIYDIVNPRVGMVVYVAEEKKNYIITKLKAVVIGGVNVPDAAVKSYELLDKHATDRLMGRAADSNSITDPFKFLGNYEGSIQDLWDTLDGFTGDSTVGSEGYFRARNGNSLIEIVSYPISYKENYWLQIVKGKLKVDDTGAIVSSTNFNILSRVHNYKGAGWSNWELIAGGDLVAAINNNIESLSDAITAEEIRAEGAEQALELSINSEITRAKAVEQELQRYVNSVYEHSFSTRDFLGAEVSRAKAAEQGLTNKINTLIGGVPDETLDTVKEIADWLLSDKTGTQAIINKIGANTAAIKDEVARATQKENSLEEKIAKEKTAIVNGDTIAGQTREIYSRTGKTDSATFLERTTAGSTSISDGVASVKQIGGNIVKNLVDGVLLSGLSATGGTVTVENGIVVFSSSSIKGVGSLRNYKTPAQTEVYGHKYYQACLLKCSENPNEKVSVGWGTLANTFPAGFAAIAQSHTDWQLVSTIYTSYASTVYHSVVVRDNRTSDWGKIYVKNYLYIDLTEMFGAGKEPTKEECDKMFGAMGALPQGLTIAQPTGLKSTGYNQWNPANIIKDKTIANNAITDLAGGNIAVVECLPCAVGAGENNGYVIGYGEGDSWSDDGIEVYLSPLNPMEIEGELFMHKLEKDTDYGTYVPQIKGYLLVVTPTTDKFCAHLHWSGDRAKTDYEEYIESNVSIPTIPQMSEWGLAGISTSGTLAADTIDLDRMVYTKRIGRIDMGTMAWNMTTVKTPDEKSTYSMFQSYTLNGKFLKPAVGKTANGMVYRYTPIPSRTVATQEVTNRSIMLYNTGYLYIRDDTYASADAFKAAMQGVMLYFELAEPEEYPIVTKTAPNYIGSDYGVEKWLGSKVPLSANILFYMRSLVGETRNFLDRLMGALGGDVITVADKIIAAVQQHSEVVNVEPEIEGEE